MPRRQNWTAVIKSPCCVEVEKRAVREPREGEVLVRSLVSGISAGTEMNVYRGTAPQWRMRRDPATGLFAPSDEPDWTYPLAYGYANAGRVEALGEGVEGFAEGDAVFTYSPHQTYSTVTAEAVVPLGALRDPRHGVFVANLNTALNGILDARLPFGATVVVSGLGVIGQLVAQLARRGGADLIVTIDPVMHRRELSLSLGADATFESGPAVAEAVRALSTNRGADVVFEVSGSPAALHEAIRIAGLDALVVAMSWYRGSFESLSLGGEFHHNRVQIHSSFVGHINPDLGPLWSVQRRMELVLRLLTELDLTPLLTHQFNIREAALAYETVHLQREGLMQCVLDYGS